MGLLRSEFQMARWQGQLRSFLRPSPVQILYRANSDTELEARPAGV